MGPGSDEQIVLGDDVPLTGAPGHGSLECGRQQFVCLDAGKEMPRRHNEIRLGRDQNYLFFPHFFTGQHTRNDFFPVLAHPL